MVCSVEVLFLAEPVRSHTHDKMITIQDGTKMRKPITAGTYYERCRRKKEWNDSRYDSEIIHSHTHTHTHKKNRNNERTERQKKLSHNTNSKMNTEMVEFNDRTNNNDDGDNNNIHNNIVTVATSSSLRVYLLLCYCGCCSNRSLFRFRSSWVFFRRSNLSPVRGIVDTRTHKMC